MKMPSAHVGAVLSLPDGPPGCDPGFYVVRCRFRLFRLYLLYSPLEVRRLYSLLALVAEGGLGQGPVHLLVGTARVIEFTWDPREPGWVRRGLPHLRELVGPFQHFKSSILDAWKNKVCFDLSRRQGFQEGPMLDIAGSLQLLRASHVGERDKALLRGIMVGVFGMDFFSVMPGEKSFRAASAAGLIEMDICFGNALTSPLIQIRENPEFHDLIQRDKSAWPRCLL